MRWVLRREEMLDIQDNIVPPLVITEQYYNSVWLILVIKYQIGRTENTYKNFKRINVLTPMAVHQT